MEDSNKPGSVKDDLFNAIGMADLTDEEKAGLFVSMLDLLQARTIALIAEKATDEQRAKMQEIVSTDQPGEALEDYLEENFPEYPQMFEEEARKLREELIIKFSK